jgi:lipopolysaccharide export system protein LptA
VNYTLTRKIHGTLALPDLNLDNDKITVSQNLFEEVAVDSSGAFADLKIQVLGASPLNVFYEYEKDEYVLIAQAIVLKGESNPKISYESTALAMIWDVLDFTSLELSQYAQLYVDIQSDNNVKALANYLKVGLLKDLDMLSKWADPDLVSAYTQALTSVSDILKQKYAASQISTNKILSQNNSLAVATNREPTITPDIPDTWYGDGASSIKIRFDEQKSGGIDIRNDTTLKLAYQIVSLYDDMIIIPYDLKMSIPEQNALIELEWQWVRNNGKWQWPISSIDGGYRAKPFPVDLKGVSRRVQILSGAVKHGNFPPVYSPYHSPDSNERDTYLRLFKDGFWRGNIVPPLNLLLVLEPTGGGSWAMPVLDATVQSIIMEKSFDEWTKDTAKAYVAQVWNVFLDKLAANTTLEKSMTKKIGKWVKGKVISVLSMPGEVGWWGNYVADAFDNDSLIDFDVKFPVEIIDVEPKSINITKILESDEEKYVTVYIIGNGFDTGCQITVTADSGKEVFKTKEILEGPIGDFLIKIPTRAFDQALGGAFIPPVFFDVKVEQPAGETDKYAYDVKEKAIELTGELKLTSVEPSRGAPNIVIKLYGSYFGSLDQNVWVKIGDKDIDAIRRLSETEVEVDLSQVKLEPGKHRIQAAVAVPSGGRIWMDGEVYYEVAGTNVTITVWDSGSAKDDAFKLLVDGVDCGDMVATSWSSYSRSWNIQLSPRAEPYRVDLRGVAAPDGIGTYSISFTGATLTSPSAPTTGNDLTPGVVRTFWIVVPDNINAASRTDTVLRETAYPNLPAHLDTERNQ